MVAIKIAHNCRAPTSLASLGVLAPLRIDQSFASGSTYSFVTTTRLSSCESLTTAGPLIHLPRPRNGDLDTLLEDHAMGGIGYRLVHKYVDDSSYQHQDGCNHLTLTKKVAPQEAGA